MTVFWWVAGVSIAVGNIIGAGLEIGIGLIGAVPALFIGWIVAVFFSGQTCLECGTRQKPQKVQAQDESTDFSFKPQSSIGLLIPDDKRFYVHLDNEVKGPFTAPELEGLAKAGVLKDNTQLCIEGENDWHPVYRFTA